MKDLRVRRAVIVAAAAGCALLSLVFVLLAVDVVRYVAGRLSEPPMPAGVLPGTSAAARVAPSEETAASYVPVAYRPATAPPPLTASRPLPEPAVTP